MSTHKDINKICCVVLAATLVLTILFMNGTKLGITAASAVMGYESKLFDTSLVHSVNIIMDDWDGFLDSCINEEYVSCMVVIDNEVYKNVGLRAKGNTSLTQVQSYGNDRYSFKIEFDHYDSTQSYYGLDKLCLNNIIQDNTYMKDYLTYRMMGEFGIAAPLCSYVYITVNGEDWGLYLAVEGVEETFLQRNYGSDYGNLYKPDSQSMGGGRGNGREFNMGDFEDFFNQTPDGEGSMQLPENTDFMGRDMTDRHMGGMDGDMADRHMGGMDGDMADRHMGGMDGDIADRHMGGMDGGMIMGSDDVSLIYTDDEYSSYSNIFDNAKTDITDKDKDRLIASLKSLNACENLEDIVDIDAVIRYFVVHNFVLNFDSYTGSIIHNYYLYEKDGQMSMIPWDYNLAFGGFQSATDATSLVNYPIDSPVSGGTIDSRPMLGWIFSNEEYTDLYHQYFREFIAELFDSGNFAETLDSTIAMLMPYVEKDPTSFCTYEEFLKGAATLKEFCLLRAESIKGQLDGTIASTSQTQAQNSDNFVNAEEIVVSDMGSMNNSMGDGSFNFGDGRKMPQEDGGTAQMPQYNNVMGITPNMPDLPGQSNTGNSSWLLLGASIGILLLGLLTGALYKKR